MAPPAESPRDVDSSRVQREVADDVASESGQDRWFAGVAPLVFRPEPVPKAAPVGGAGLLGTGHHERVPLGQFVHPCTGGEVGRVLLAAVEHDDEWYRLADVATGNVEVVVARPGGLGMGKVAGLASGLSKPSGDAPIVTGRGLHMGVDAAGPHAVLVYADEAAASGRTTIVGGSASGDPSGHGIRRRACVADSRIVTHSGPLVHGGIRSSYHRHNSFSMRSSCLASSPC
jgi:hypothetical protein